jgi:hypothetical protein
MRPPSAAADVRLRPSFLRMIPARKPRTECCCHPVVCTIASMVAPLGARSIAMIRACLLSLRSFGCSEDCDRRPAVRRAPRLDFAVLRVELLRFFMLRALECDLVSRFDFGFLIGISFVYAASIAAPPKPHHGISRRGVIPKRCLSPGTERSTAPFAPRSQSFPDNLIAGFAEA